MKPGHPDFCNTALSAGFSDPSCEIGRARQTKGLRDTEKRQKSRSGIVTEPGSSMEDDRFLTVAARSCWTVLYLTDASHDGPHGLAAGEGAEESDGLAGTLSRWFRWRYVGRAAPAAMMRGGSNVPPGAIGVIAWGAPGGRFGAAAFAGRPTGVAESARVANLGAVAELRPENSAPKNFKSLATTTRPSFADDIVGVPAHPSVLQYVAL